MQKTDVAGLKINSPTKPELLQVIEEQMRQNLTTWVTTAYSEFLFWALKTPKVMEMLNKSDIVVPDGIGIFWAKRFLNIPLSAKNYWLRVLQAYWQVKYSLLAILFYPKWINQIFQEKIVGADLIWDIAALAAKNNFSVYLLGGFGDTAKVASEKLKKSTSSNYSGRYNLMISGWSSKNPSDATVIDDINNAQPDIVFVAYGPIKQEEWIFQNRDKLNTVKLFMGVGGSFDYISGKRIEPPGWMRKIGLEWLWRLFTQPHRLKRIYNSTLGLIGLLTRYKVFESLPLRQNVVSVILNKKNEILVFKRTVQNPEDKLYGFNPDDVVDHWQFPQGGKDGQESYLETGIRECREEVGLTQIKYLTTSTKTHTYHYYNALRPFFHQLSQFRGQEQHIVYFKFEGANQDVKIDNFEFENYQWVKSQDLNNILHPTRIPVGKIVLQDLKEMPEKGMLT